MVTGRQLLELLSRREYLRKPDLLKDSINDVQRLYFQSYMDNTFNSNEKAIEHIDMLINDHAEQLPDSLQATLYEVKQDSYFKLFQYAKAAQCDSMLLDHYLTVLDSAKVENIKNRIIIRNGLKNIPPQQIIKTGNADIKSNWNKLRLLTIPIKLKTLTFNAIVDTGANISCVSETYATLLGLKILPATFTVKNGVTGNKIKSGLGIADSLRIGNIVIDNAIFQIMPDSSLYTAPAKFSWNIIIGFPVTRQLEEIHIHKNGSITIPLNASKSELRNFALDGAEPVIQLLSDPDTLYFHLDLGARRSLLYNNYFQKYKEYVLLHGMAQSRKLFGPGGMQQMDIYMPPALELTLNKKTIAINNVDVLTHKTSLKENFYGNLGIDFVSKFDEVVLNFKDMYISTN